MDFLKYTVWPGIKVRAMYWWWIIKYGGKKHIPPELLFEKMARNAEVLRENLVNALRHMPDDLNKDEKQELMDLLRLSTDLDAEMRNMKPRQIIRDKKDAGS